MRPLPGGEPFVPEAGTLYWVETTILPPGDPEDQRAVVVLEAPATVDGTIVVATLSGSGTGSGRCGRGRAAGGSPAASRCKGGCGRRRT